MVTQLRTDVNSLNDRLKAMEAAATASVNEDTAALKGRFDALVARHFPSFFDNHPAATPGAKPTE